MNKEELKHTLDMDSYGYPDMEPEIDEEAAESVEYKKGFNNAIKLAISKIDQLDEPQKAVVPDFVGGLIELQKEHISKKGRAIQALNHKEIASLDFDPRPSMEWVNKNYEEYCKAFTNGYTVEEKKYQVIIGGYVLRKFNNTNKFQMVTKGSPKLDNLNGCKINLTEQEIKDIDPRLWSLAEEVK